MKFFVLVCLYCFISIAYAADPWADTVIEFYQGIGQHNGVAAFSDPAKALGAPTPRGTNRPSTEGLVSLGQGGHLILAFDEPVTDDQMNPEGYDLIVFGNSFWLNGTAYGYKFMEPAYVEVAEDKNADGVYQLAIDGPFYLLLPPSYWPTELRATQVGGGYYFIGDTGNTVTPLAGYAEVTPGLVLGDMNVDNHEDDTAITPEQFYTIPDRHADLDDTESWKIDPGSCGGDAFDIKWAVVVDYYTNNMAFIPSYNGIDEEEYDTGILGQPVPLMENDAPVSANITSFSFVRIVDAVPNDFFNEGLYAWLDIDSEIDAVADVAPMELNVQVAKNADGSMTLSWDAVPAAMFYDVYYSDVIGNELALCVDNLDSQTLAWTDEGDTDRLHPVEVMARFYQVLVRRD